MDIEGTEYAVMPEILDSGIEIGQICIEVHGRFFADGEGRTKELFRQLNSHGYLLAHISENGEEMTFIKQ